ncbi:hypothetical protein SAMN04487772_107127 [[Clostridium] polysaccharolyticum]|uniref:Uncharacterized protein n=1 Tax=[Clostridium] polysaccharolyticum TaxID=29364 RepID=A0A1I0BGP8_9FIRM|nr:hypothetical protein SAMN04487772_107127 [[Clostridium] polysaccharolyticum]
MKETEVYLFGQVLGIHSFLLKDGFLKPDKYSEIKEQYFLGAFFILKIWEWFWLHLFYLMMVHK